MNTTIPKYTDRRCYKSPEYLKMCKKHPNFRHLLPDHPEPPVKLLPCPFCGGAGVPWFTCDTCFMSPAFYIRCTSCGLHTFPSVWGCSGLTAGSDWHTITEQEALEKACKAWNCQKGA